MRRINFFPLVILGIVSFLIDYYTFSGVGTLTKNLSESRFNIHIFYWVCSLCVLLTFLILLSQVITSHHISSGFKIAFNIFITVFVSKLAFSSVLFIEDVYRFVAALISLLMKSRFEISDRNFIWSQFALLISSIPFFSFLFGVTFGKYHYKVRKVELFFKDLPNEFHNFKIAQISDIHAGSFDNPKAVAVGIDMLNAEKPDLVAFTGDLINNQASEILPYINIFKQIKAPYGLFSVLGNHDYGDYINWPSTEDKRQNLVELKNYHAGIGFRLLLDEHVRIHIGNTYINIVGIENWGKGFGEKGDLVKAISGTNPADFKILLSHDPSHWDAQVKNNPEVIHLTLSGHTHGMQFGIEIGKFKWSPVKYRYPNWAGLAENNGRYLYVNRGFGFIGFSGRVGIWPEITIITLKKG